MLLSPPALLPLLLVGASLATLASAQFLSTACQRASDGLGDNKGYRKCLNSDAITNNLKESTPVVALFDNWLKGACDEDCPAEVLANAVNTVREGCATDLAAGNEEALKALDDLQNFAKFQDVLCLQTISNSTFCITSIFAELERSIGYTLNAGNLGSAISSIPNVFSSPSPHTPCTDCGHASISVSGDTGPTTQEALQACGAEFGDGKIPSTIRIAPRAPANGVGVVRPEWVVAVLVGMGGMALGWC